MAKQTIFSCTVSYSKPAMKTSFSLPKHPLTSSPANSISFPILRPLSTGSISNFVFTATYTSSTTCTYAANSTLSSVSDPSPNWSNRPPKEIVMLDGCDFNHWLVVMDPPEGNPTRDEIIDSYIKTLAMVLGSEEEARLKIYSVSTRCYYAFGALVSEELSHKIRGLPKVRWVLPDSYLDVKNKDYGGEPFIDGKAVPYDPKYHADWIKNNENANKRNKRSDRPRNFDRSRNYERRRENIQNRDFSNSRATSTGYQGPASKVSMADQGMQNPGMPQNGLGRWPPPPPSN